ncbi:helix-turn-helix domain-containing protein [Cellulomonas fengjieae]|uniref:Cupin domain-containing protein n=1 Tax=Cellulomonas fengjieae TaxID=2819978 RepID=A0ABS3SH89_9CELL|nr:XRE family transcriptional regulator [Cellulomonas fengjieae]MBO3085108.1 cupin domain-containing protein [Cellulomonas fengjieae]MBO3100854.1 cupin domain-containing protein [Cellulomonas fengjieae]QVI66310.1 cupin domain-containing protein [Cellulomonas fengjieae]
MDDVDRMMRTVGPRLRAVRRQRGLTLAQASDATGISVSTLSRLESGSRRPQLELLVPLAGLYRVPLDELVGAPATGDPRIHPRPVTEFGMTVIPLSRRSGGMLVYKMVIAPGGPHPDPELNSHEGYEWLYVIDGHLRLVLGEHDLVLPPGEAAEFDTRVPHWFGNETAEPVELLSIFGTQGERVHLRARPRSTQGSPTPGQRPDET